MVGGKDFGYGLDSILPVLLPFLKASHIIGRTLNQVKKSKYFKYYSDDNVDIYNCKSWTFP